MNMKRLDANNAYSKLDKLLGTILDDMDILAGDTLGPSDASWQDVAGTLSVNMKLYARLLDAIRIDAPGAMAFPSIRDKIDD